jgi:hypothetical protein
MLRTPNSHRGENSALLAQLDLVSEKQQYSKQDSTACHAASHAPERDAHFQNFPNTVAQLRFHKLFDHLK